MIPIKYVKGDATEPIGDGRKIIIHVCNDIGAWGSGFVLAVSKKWGQPKSDYMKWKKGRIQKPPFKLGEVRFVRVEKDLAVGNMIGQHDIQTKNGLPPVRYGAIRRCLEKVCIAAKKFDCSVHAPRFGSDRAGGDWDKIEQLIIGSLSSQDIEVTIYDLP